MVWQRSICDQRNTFVEGWREGENSCSVETPQGYFLLPSTPCDTMKMSHSWSHRVCHQYLSTPCEGSFIICPLPPNWLLVLSGKGLSGGGSRGASLPWKNFHAYKHESNGSNLVWPFLNFIWDMLKTGFPSYPFFFHTPVLQPLVTEWLSGEELFL